MTPRLIINSSSITIELVRVVRISKRRVIISQHSTKQMFFFNPHEVPPATVQQKGGLDVSENRKNPLPYRDSNPR